MGQNYNNSYVFKGNISRLKRKNDIGLFYILQVLKMFNIKKKVYNVLKFYFKNEKITKYE